MRMWTYYRLKSGTMRCWMLRASIGERLGEEAEAHRWMVESVDWLDGWHAGAMTSALWTAL
jgi:hypothetical protein